MSSVQSRWLRVVQGASDPAVIRSTSLGGELLDEALSLGASITSDSVGCSITETTDTGFFTPAASSSLAMVLDLAQYTADDGPCVAACRDGQVHSIQVMGDETAFSGFTAAAARQGVRSSLSLPLSLPGRASALNLYASSVSAFEDTHARAVALFLARCVGALLPAGSLPETETAVQSEVVRARRDLIARAQQAIRTRKGGTDAQAFLLMTQLSRHQQKSIFLVAADLAGGVAGE